MTNRSPNWIWNRSEVQSFWTQICTSYSFHVTHVDNMLFFEDVWFVATNQTTKYGRSDKTSLVRYNSVWCRFGVVHVHVH